METRRNDFFYNKKLAGRLSNQRFGHYVLIPGCPIFPTRHPGVDDERHPKYNISYDHYELLKLGEATIQTLLNSDEKVCPRVIFLTCEEDDMDLYGDHLLSTYIDLIQKEKQFPFVLHIAGHGSPEKIGSLDPEARLSMDLFVSMLAILLNDIKNKDISIVFHTCNSAYCDINENMSNEEIADNIYNNTLIGRFVQEMFALGFDNLTVTGYRGYYSHMKSHKGSVVTDDLYNPKIEMLDFKAAVTVFSDFSDGRVDFSGSSEGKFFKVHFANKDNETENPPAALHPG